MKITDLALMIAVGVVVFGAGFFIMKKAHDAPSAPSAPGLLAGTFPGTAWGLNDPRWGAADWEG